jgi:AraC family transcriptional regulator
MIGLSGDLCLVQKDGCPPTTLVAGRAPGESGVSILNLRFEGGMHLSAALLQHVVCFHTEARFDCRIADCALRHVPPTGSLAICPAGVDCKADAEGSLDLIVIAIDPERFSLAAAQDAAVAVQLKERLAGFDGELLAIARALTAECAQNFPNGPLHWNALAQRFIDALVARHSAGSREPVRGTLEQEVLGRLKAYVLAHIDEPIEVSALAAMADRSPFHFSRVFKRSVGVTPHRYVVHLRLERAAALLREGQASLAEVAARTGFADQSHLSRWARRVYGVLDSRNVHDMDALLANFAGNRTSEGEAPSWQT